MAESALAWRLLWAQDSLKLVPGLGPGVTGPALCLVETFPRVLFQSTNRYSVYYTRLVGFEDLSPWRQYICFSARDSRMCDLENDPALPAQISLLHVIAYNT